MTENERLTFETELGISIDKNEDCPTMSICWNCDIKVKDCKYFNDAVEKLAKYEAIGTIEEFKASKEYKAKMEMQYLDDINNPLEPLKLSSALQSEIHKYNYRKEHKPQDISPLDYTIIYALKHCLEEQMEET